MRRLLGIVVALALGPGVRPSAAQCPDGAPPPCATPRAAPARIPVDSNALAVLPFRTTGPTNEVAWLGEGMVDLLSISLDGFAGWRTVHPRTVLARTGTMPSANDVAASGRAARSAGAATMVLGTAVAVGPELRLHAELYDAVRLRRLAAVDATGALALPGPVVDSVAVGLARGRLQQRPVLGNRPLNEYATTSPQALRAYLAAEQLARRGLLQPAADSLLRVIALDSTFGLAYYRLWVVTTFGATPPPFWTARNIVLQGLRHAAALPQRQRDLLTALDVQYRGLITEALRQAEELGRRYPDDAEAAYVQGEAYAAAGLPGADSLYGSLGASWRAAADGDTALALAALRAGFATRPEVVEATFGGLRGLIALSRGDTATARAGLRQGLSLAPYDVLTPLRGDLTRKTTLHGRFAVALAQIERADGDLGSALNRLRFTSYATGLVVERAEAEEVRAEIAAQQGDTAVAVRAYRNFIALWKDADPELQARVATARDALTRLAH